MTREEAIKWLKSIYCRFNPTGEILENEGGDVHLQALKMAIEALSVDAVPHGRLIDADALSEKLCETTIFIKDGEVFQLMINDAPTESAEPKTGEWVKVIDEETPNVTTWHYECNQCGQPHDRSKYCPNCGAKMKGGAK